MNIQGQPKKKKRRNEPVIMCPPGVDLGHPTTPGELNGNMQGMMMNLLGGVGGELQDVTRSEQNDLMRTNRRSWDNGADLGAVSRNFASQIGMYANAPAPQPQQVSYVQQQPVMTPVPQPQYYCPQPQQVFMNKEVDISKYIGETVTTNTNNGTNPIEVSFSNALKPIDDKAEAACKILGKIYQKIVELETAVKGLPSGIGEVIVSSMNTMLAEPPDDDIEVVEADNEVIEAEMPEGE